MILFHYRDKNGNLFPYEENTSLVLYQLVVSGLIQEITLIAYPHRINLIDNTIKNLETLEEYTLIYGQPNAQYPDGLPLLTMAQLHEYARLC